MEIKRKIVATRENERTILTITHDGFPLTCPLKPPTAIQNQLGSLNFIEHNCSSKCVGFNVRKKRGSELHWFKCKFMNIGMFQVEIDNGLNQDGENSNDFGGKIMNLT